MAPETAAAKPEAAEAPQPDTADAATGGAAAPIPAEKEPLP